MADAPVVHVGENSPEEVALKLLRIIALGEKMNVSTHGTGNNPDRKWILSTYGECIRTVRNGYPPKNE